MEVLVRETFKSIEAMFSEIVPKERPWMGEDSLLVMLGGATINIDNGDDLFAPFTFKSWDNTGHEVDLMGFFSHEPRGRPQIFAPKMTPVDLESNWKKTMSTSQKAAVYKHFTGAVPGSHVE